MDKFNFKHFFFIICSVTIAALKTYPQIFMRIAGRNSWVCIIIASLIFILCADFIIKIYINNDCENLHDIFTLALGKFFGKLFLALFAFVLFLSLVESAALETSVVHYNLFIESPNWYILLFIILPGLYTVVKGKNAVMAALMICIFISIINGINLYILTYPFKKYKWLFPIFESGINFEFFIAILKALGLYASISIALPYLSLINKTKKLRSLTFATNAFIAQMIIVTVTGILSTFSVQRANTILFPKITQTQLISYFGFIASGEFYVIYQVISSWFAKYTAALFALLIVLKELNIGKFCNVKYLPYTISVVAYMTAYSLSSSLLKLFKFLNYYDYICIGGYLVMPIMVFALYSIKSKNKSLKQN